MYSYFLLSDILVVIICYGPAKYKGHTKTSCHKIVMAGDQYILNTLIFGPSKFP